MGRITPRKVLLAVALGLLVLFLHEEFRGDKTIHTPKSLREEDSTLLQVTTNKTHVLSLTRCQQNASNANVTGFSLLPRNIQDFLYYRHCRRFPLLLDVPDKCRGTNKSSKIFLLVIKSRPINYDRRDVLRKTWAKERLRNGVWIRRLFITGTSDPGIKKARHNKLLELEQSENNDILQWDFKDTFNNLTLKQVLFLEWMERRCPKAHFLFNGDDDVFANTDNMVEFLQGLDNNDGSKHLFTGHLIQYVGPIRLSWSKYYVPVQIYKSGSYPPYCGGGGFLLSGYTAKVIYNMSKLIPLFPIDDVYMGMCLAKAGLGPKSHVGVKTSGISIPYVKMDDYIPCYYKEMLLVHRFLPGYMYLLWQKIHDLDLKCN